MGLKAYPCRGSLPPHSYVVSALLCISALAVEHEEVLQGNADVNAFLQQSAPQRLPNIDEFESIYNEQVILLCDIRCIHSRSSFMWRQPTLA